MISSSRNEEMSSGIDEMDAEGNAGITRFFTMHCENFARIAKILQPSRKFCNTCEISLCTIFRYDSENSLS